MDGVLGDSDGQRDAESQQPVSVPLRGESESILSTYLILISILLMVQSPLAVPVAITVAPWLSRESVASAEPSGGVTLPPESPDHNRAKPER